MSSVLDRIKHAFTRSPRPKQLPPGSYPPDSGREETLGTITKHQHSVDDDDEDLDDVGAYNVREQTQLRGQKRDTIQSNYSTQRLNSYRNGLTVPPVPSNPSNTQFRGASSGFVLGIPIMDNTNDNMNRSPTINTSVIPRKPSSQGSLPFLSQIENPSARAGLNPISTSTNNPQPSGGSSPPSMNPNQPTQPTQPPPNNPQSPLSKLFPGMNASQTSPSSATTNRQVSQFSANAQNTNPQSSPSTSNLQMDNSNNPQSPLSKLFPGMNAGQTSPSSATTNRQVSQFSANAQNTNPQSSPSTLNLQMDNSNNPQSPLSKLFPGMNASQTSPSSATTNRQVSQFNANAQNTNPQSSPSTSNLQMDNSNNPTNTEQGPLTKLKSLFQNQSNDDDNVSRLELDYPIENVLIDANIPSAIAIKINEAIERDRLGNAYHIHRYTFESPTPQHIKFHNHQHMTPHLVDNSYHGGTRHIREIHNDHQNSLFDDIAYPRRSNRHNRGWSHRYPETSPNDYVEQLLLSPNTRMIQLQNPNDIQYLPTQHLQNNQIIPTIPIQSSINPFQLNTNMFPEPFFYYTARALPYDPMRIY